MQKAKARDPSQMNSGFGSANVAHLITGYLNQPLDVRQSVV